MEKGLPFVIQSAFTDSNRKEEVGTDFAIEDLGKTLLDFFVPLADIARMNSEDGAGNAVTILKTFLLAGKTAVRDCTR